MKVIVGLGNPTDQYKGTRHNVGYMAIDRIAEANRININQHKFKAMVGSGIIGGSKVLLVKPLTYMNLSGESIRPIMDFYKLDLSDILVIYDDISLEPGMLRLRTKGSAGGHNGMKSIIKHLGGALFHEFVSVLAGKNIRDRILQTMYWDILKMMKEITRRVFRQGRKSSRTFCTG